MANDFMEVDGIDDTAKTTDVTEKNVNAKYETPHQEKSNINEYRYNILDLPSNGKLNYPATLEYRDMLFSEEKQLSTATEDTYVRTLNNVLRSVANDLKFYEELSVHDRDYFLMWVWANNYGVHRDLEIKCPSCGNNDKVKIDLRELEVVPLPDDFVEPFKFTTKFGDEIGVRALRVKDELRAEKYIREQIENGVDQRNIDNIVNLMLTFSIDIGKAASIDDKIKWVEKNLTTRDIQMVRQFHEYFEFGVDDIVKHECTKCAKEVTGRVPFFPTGDDEQAVQDDFRNLLQANKGTSTSAE